MPGIILLIVGIAVFALLVLSVFGSKKWMWVFTVVVFIVGLTVGLIARGYPDGLLLGTIAGIFFSISIIPGIAITRRQRLKAKERLILKPGIFRAEQEKIIGGFLPKLPEDEKLIKQSPANHFKGPLANGGRLFLTSQNLYFRTHSLNWTEYGLCIPISQIDNVRVFSAYFVLPKGLEVMTRSGQKARFIVDSSDEWRRTIDAAVDYGTVRQEE